MHAIVWTHLLSKNGLVNQCIAHLFSLKETPFDIYGLAGAIFVKDRNEVIQKSGNYFDSLYQGIVLKNKRFP